jgi:hypothetical protein
MSESTVSTSADHTGIGAGDDPSGAQKLAPPIPTLTGNADATATGVAADGDAAAPKSSPAPTASDPIESPADEEVGDGAASAQAEVPNNNPKKRKRHVSSCPPKARKASKATVQRSAEPAKPDDNPADTTLVQTAAPQTAAEGGNAVTDATAPTTDPPKVYSKAQPGKRPHGTPRDVKQLRKFASSQGYALHDIVFSLPPMSPAEYEALKESIRGAGRLFVPIWTREGKIIDGLHRLRACKELGVTPTFEECRGEGSVIEHVVGLNCARRHLTPAQRAAMAVELLPHYKQEARRRQKRHGGTAPGRPAETLESNLTGVSLRGGAREAVARACGVSAGYVSYLARVKKEDPALIGRVLAGEKTVIEALAALEARRPKGHPDTPSTHNGRQDVGQGGGDGGSAAPGTPAPAASASAARPTREPAAPESAPACQRNNPEPTGPSTAPPADDTTASDSSPKNDTAPPRSKPQDGEAGPPKWTKESVDQALAQAGELFAVLTALDGDPEARDCVGQLDRQRRAEHRATLLAGSNLLPRLLALLGDDAT